MYLKDIIRGEITMKALRFYDVQDLRYEDAPDPVIEKPDDVIVKVKAVGNLWFRYCKIQKPWTICTRKCMGT